MRSASSPAVSFSKMGSVKVSSMAPVSMPASIFISVTPVSRSPRTTDHVIGAAPRYFGKSDPCTFTQPRRGASRTSWGRMRP